MPTTLHTVIVFTKDMQRLADFYQAGLGLGEPESSPGHLGFVELGTYFGFDEVDDPPPPGAVTLWFEVDDLEKTFAAFVESGAKVRYAPTHKPWGGYLASLYDPDGNLFGLSQRG